MGEKSTGEQPNKKGKRTYHASIGTPPQNTHLSIHEMQQIGNSAFAVALIKVRRFLHGNAEYVQTGTGWLIAPWSSSDLLACGRNAAGRRRNTS